MKIIIIEFNHQNNHNESNSHVCYMSDSEHFWVKKYAHCCCKDNPNCEDYHKGSLGFMIVGFQV